MTAPTTGVAPRRSPQPAGTRPEAGFARYQTFFNQPPALLVRWHDEHSPARGYLCINQLRGGAAGGGTRMRPGASADEAIFLAKTMQAKFNVCGPAIGGGKSVIDFDAVGAARAASGGRDPSPGAVTKIKHQVLARWFKHIAPYLKSCYGTGGDVGVDEALDAIPVSRRAIDLAHPQEGIVRGHFPRATPAQFARSIRQLQTGVLAPVDLPGLPRRTPWTIADVATGWGVVCALRAYYAARGETLNGKRAIIEGFGAVGGFTAYYLHQLGAVVVTASSAGGGPDHRGIRVASDDRGLDVLALLRQRQHTSLPAPARNASVRDATGDADLFAHRAEIFVPAALSHTIGLGTLDHLEGAGVRVIAPGANNPFRATTPARAATQIFDEAPDRGATAPMHAGELVANMLVRMRQADRRFALVPDFIANSGMARTFAYLMRPGASTAAPAILADIRASVERAMRRLLRGADLQAGLLDRAYATFL